MASRRTVELVQATVPALQAHGLALTTHFYTLMFTHEPELKNIFNLGNQAGGQQQQALAQAVLADADYYLCDTLLSWGVPAGRVHYEVFGPDQIVSA